MENFQCIESDDKSGYYLQSALYIQCTFDTSISPYFYYLFLPSFIFGILYILGIPFLFFLLLFLNRSKFNRLETKELMGFLYENFREDLWWTEILLLGRRIIIAASLSIFPTFYSIPEVIVILTLALYLAFFLIFRPFKRIDEINAEILTTLSIYMLMIIGTYYQDSNSNWLNILGVIIYLMTLLFLFVVLIYPQLRRFGVSTLCCVRPFYFIYSKYYKNSYDKLKN